MFEKINDKDLYELAKKLNVKEPNLGREEF